MTHRVCSHPACATITSGARLCATHRRLDDNMRAARRQRDGRGLAAWPRTRRLVLERDNHLCPCGQAATHVHRIARGYHDDSLAAYQSLCPSCHGRLHRAEQHAAPAPTNAPPMPPRSPLLLPP